MSLPSLKSWFKNVGQSAAQNETFVEEIFPKSLDSLLSEKEEEDYFDILRKISNLSTIHNDIRPGSEGYFYSGVGLTDEAWTNFTNNNGPPKFTYVMSILTYGSEDLDNRNRIATETCVIYMNKDRFNSWLSCRSGHNGIHKAQ
jgi:hypothetical protein